jgi:hypothetical protein
LIYQHTLNENKHKLFYLGTSESSKILSSTIEQVYRTTADFFSPDRKHETVPPSSASSASNDTESPISDASQHSQKGPDIVQKKQSTEPSPSSPPHKTASSSYAFDFVTGYATESICTTHTSSSLSTEEECPGR